MARRRGFLAELQYQNQLAEKRRIQAQRAQVRATVAAQREYERAQKAAERAAVAASRASAAEQKAAAREAKRLREEAQLAEVDALNSRLAETADEIATILAATLAVDDYVDLETLRVVADHPPFPRADLEVPSPEAALLVAPPEPVFAEPPAPTGFGGMLGGKKKHAAAVALAREAFDLEYRQWQTEAAGVPARQLELLQERDAAEERRLGALASARAAYEMECQARELQTAESNAALDALISGLAAGEAAAVDEYVGIVLGNTVYPELLAVAHDYEYDAGTRELSLTVLIAAPDRFASEKSYRYVKAKDEIVATPLSKKELKERYADVTHQVALRTLHEVFEADRPGHIQTIALQVATEARDPATGLESRIAFVGVAAEREAFTAFDLDNVVPAATLQHLGAALSKSPHDLVPIDRAPGVRGR